MTTSVTLQIQAAAMTENIEINLSELEPLIALPGSPDAVHKVRDVQELMFIRYSSAPVPIQAMLK